jgi:hypothetical protein
MDSSEEDHFYHDIHTILKGSGKGMKRHASIASIASKANRRRRIKKTNTLHWFQMLLDFGWREDYIVHTFGHINDSLIRNWPDTLLTTDIFSYLIRQQGWLGSIQESLHGIGLRSDVAEKLDDILSPLFESSYTTVQLLDQAIEYVKGLYVPITPPFTSHYVQPEYVDQWISYSPSPKKTIMMYNIPYSCDEPDMAQKIALALSLFPTMDAPFYFHATSWNSSRSILRRISCYMGRPCLDFNIFPAFYLSTTTSDCVDWCIKNQKKWGNEVAILVFSIPDNKPSSIQTIHLTGKEWVDVTKESRECVYQDREVKLIEDIDLVFGNMVENPEKVRLHQELPMPHSPPKKQLAGLTDVAERFLYECLVGCIYFQKYNAST